MARKTEQLIPVGGVAWDVEPPYAHPWRRLLTYGQLQRYQLLAQTDSLSAAYDYALKVGKVCHESII